MDRRDVHATLPWMGAGTEFLGRLVDSLPDDALRAPSGLPGWSRAHVVAHLARNAEALIRLATWGRTGVETPMYANAQQRDADIASSSTALPEALRQDLRTTADALDVALAALHGPAWQAPVRSAQGREIPVAEVPWMRVREVWLHAVDLHCGAVMADLPAAVVDVLLDDVTAALTTRDGCPAVRVAPTDRDRTWALGPGTDAVDVRGEAAEVLGWLTGRVDLAGPAPRLPRWL